MHVAVIDNEPCWPANFGRRIRTFNLLRRAAARHRITYLCFENPCEPECSQAERVLTQYGIRTILVKRPPAPRSGPRFYLNLLNNLRSHLPYSVAIRTSPAMRQAICQLAQSEAIDLWHCEWTPLAANLDVLNGAPWILMAHNVESMIWQRYHATEQNPLKRWYIHHQWRKYEQFERHAFAQTSLLITVSELDAQTARQQFGAPRVVVVDNGVDTTYFTPDDSPRDPHAICFVGALDWRPNQDAAQLLLQEIFPQVGARIPDARCLIVGRNPPNWLRDLATRTPGAELHANVPDVRPFYQRCAALIVPLRMGGGSRLKILEALACQCPVISTRVGAEGLHLHSGREFIQVEEPRELPAAICAALEEPQQLYRLAQQGRQTVLVRYDWDTLAQRLDHAWRQVAALPAAPDAHPPARCPIPR